MVSAIGAAYSYYDVLNPVVSTPQAPAPVTPSAPTTPATAEYTVPALSNETLAALQQLFGIPAASASDNIAGQLLGGTGSTGVYGLLIGKEKDSAALLSATSLLSAAYASGVAQAAAQNATSGQQALDILSALTGKSGINLNV